MTAVVTRARQEHGLGRIGDPAVERLIALAPLVEHYALLALHLCGIERRGRQPFTQHVEACAQVVRVGGRHRELVDRLVVRGVRVDVGAERHAETSEGVDQVIRGELGGAVEQHVLEEVGDARLIGVLLTRSCVDRQPHLHAAAWSIVGAEVHGEPVLERENPYVGVVANGLAIGARRKDRICVAGDDTRIRRCAPGDERGDDEHPHTPPPPNPHTRATLQRDGGSRAFGSHLLERRKMYHYTRLRGLCRTNHPITMPATAAATSTIQMGPLASPTT